MKTAKLILASAALLTATFLTACGKSNNDNNGGGVCTYNSANQCVDVNGNVVTVSGSSIRYFSQVSQGYMTISNQSIYNAFLKNAMGVCDRYSGTNQGDYSCSDAWQGGDVQIIVTPSSNASNQYIVQIDAAKNPYKTNYSSYYTGIDSGIPVRKPLVMQTVVSVINNSQGVEARQNVNLGLFQLQIQNGNLSGGSQQLTYQLAWGDKTTNSGQVFATGTLIRY